MTAILLLFFLIISVMGNPMDSYEDDSPVTFLVTTSSGLQFKKSINDDSTVNIIYDCSIGVSDEGLVYVYYDIHPPNMKSLFIQNCSNITVDFGYPENNSPRNKYNKERLKDIKIKNVHSLTLRKFDEYYRNDYYFNQETENISVDICSVKLLKIQEETFAGERFLTNRTWSLKIQDVDLAEIKSNAIRLKALKLSLQEIRRGIIYRNSISINDRTAVLIIENSNFETVEKEGVNFEGTRIKLMNNTFKNLETDSFSLEASTSFEFSNNYIKYMTDSFHIKSPNVKIVSNTFERIEEPFLLNVVITNSFGGFSVLNVSKNTMNILPQGFFLLNAKSQPDAIYFKNNSFNCTCKYFNLVNHTNSGIDAQKILLHKNDGNVCVNLDNCPLRNIFNHMSEVCRNEFICEDEERADDTLTSILSNLKHISAKIDRLISDSSKNESPLPETTVRS